MLPEKTADPTQMGRWWPAGKTIGKSPFVEIVIEPRAGGRWFERDAEGIETNWGKVIAWEPPTRLLLGWQLDSRFAYNPDLLTEVELTFAPAAAGGAVVTLEHRNLERFGDDAEKIAAQLGGGWPQIMADYVGYAAGGEHLSGRGAAQADFHSPALRPLDQVFFAGCRLKGCPPLRWDCL